MQELGLRVTGVDQSPQMLAHLPASVEAVAGDIASLHLGRTWRAAVLASNLVKHPCEPTRASFLAAARRHLETDGALFVQRHDERWLASVEAGPLGGTAGVRMYAEEVSRNAGLVTVRLRYDGFGQSWRYVFTVEPLSEHQLADVLQRASVSVRAWHGSRRLWVECAA